MPAHLSYSPVALYLECPLLYQRRYIEGERSEATSAALAFGQAIQQALAHKTASRAYAAHQIAGDLQMLVYAAVWRAIEAEALYPRCCISTRFGWVHEECVRGG